LDASVILEEIDVDRDGGKLTILLYGLQNWIEVDSSRSCNPAAW